VSSIVLRKLRSAKARFDQQLDRWSERAIESRKERSFASWLRNLRSNPPHALVGSNFAEYGGVRHHIHAIAKYSSLDVELAPPDDLLQNLSPHEVRTRFREQFFNFEPNGIKAVHSHVFPWFIEWCRSRQRRKAKWVHTYHNPYFPEFSRGALERWQEEINHALLNDARHADLRLSVSRWQQAYLEQEHGISTSYLPNGVEVEICDQADASRFTRATGLRDFILYVGRNDPVKNPVEYVKLAERIPSQQFVMIGRELSPEALRNDWDIDVPRNLAVRGESTHAEIQDAIAACRAAVVTSKREGLPTLVLEAMTQGKSVVVPREAGCLEAIDNGRFGFIYEPGDLDDLVERVDEAMHDSIRCSSSRDRILTEYDWRVIAPRLDALYMS